MIEYGKRPVALLLLGVSILVSLLEQTPRCKE
jgi:hypothetical protein